MRPLLIPIALLLSVAASAAQPDPEAKLAGLLKGRQAGEPVSCITQLPTNRSFTIEHTGMVYDVGGTRYVNRFEGGCSQLTSSTFAVTQTPTDRLCAGDIAQIVTNPSPVIQIGSCTYGKFTPYKRAK